MKLSDTDKREMCPRCGWVGRRRFQEERHDLCELPNETLPTDDDVEESLEEVTSVDDEVVVAVETVDENVIEDEDAVDDEGDGDDEDAVDEKSSSEKEDEDKPASDRPRWSRAAARRRGIPPKKTIAVRRITQGELRAGRAELEAIGADDAYDRPRVRGDCQLCPVCQLVRDGNSDGTDSAALRAFSGAPVREAGRLVCGHRIAEVAFRSRPCVFIACKHTLFLDVSETGSIIFNFPHLEPHQMPADQSCALDLAERGAMTLEDIAVVTNLTRERIRQVELKALIRKARPAAMAMGLGSDDAAALGTRHHVGPGADLEETGIEGAVPSDIATLLGSGGSNDDGS